MLETQQSAGPLVPLPKLSSSDYPSPTLPRPIPTVTPARRRAGGRGYMALIGMYASPPPSPASMKATAAARAPGMGSGLLLSSVEYAWWLRSFESDVARTFFHLKQALEWRRAANVDQAARESLSTTRTRTL